MPKKGTDEGAKMRAAIRLYTESYSATVRQCLLGAEFLSEESDDKARQMRLRRSTKGARAPPATSTRTPRTPSDIPAIRASPVSTVSGITQP